MSSKTTQNINAVVATIISVSVNIIVIAVVIMCVYWFGIKAYEFGNAIFNVSPMDEMGGKNVVVTITEGESVMDIAEGIEKMGLIEDKYVFTVQFFLSGKKDEIIPGTYTFSTAMIPSEIIGVMTGGNQEEETK